MIMRVLAAVLCLLPALARADGLVVTDPYVPMAPPGAMAHAAFLTLENTGDAPVSLIGVSAEGYAMAHMHLSEEKDGIATMSAVHQIDIAPGESVVFKPGGLHVMLMRPDAPRSMGESVALVFDLSDGTTLPVAAKVTHMAGHSAMTH